LPCFPLVPPLRTIPVASPVDQSAFERVIRESDPLQYDNRPPQNGRPEGGGRRRRSRRHRNRFNENGAPSQADIFAQPEFPQPVGPPQLSAEQLGEMSKAELNELAKTFEIATPVKIKKDDLIAEILNIQAQRSGLENANGVLDILPEGYGFLRREGYLIGADDIYISQSQIRRFELRRGDLVAGQVRRPKDNEKYYGIVKVETVNGYDPESIRTRRSFEDLGAVAPSQRWKLATRGDVTARAIDLLAPLGRGGRTLISAPAGVDPTATIVTIARGILANDAGAHLIVLSIDGRPEDALTLQRRIDGEIVATTFDEHPDHHVATAELVMERAKRLVELGSDVVIVLDSLTRLARAFGPGSTAGRPPDFTSVAKPKRYFGTARACEEGGSLTIVAVATTGGASAFDAVVAEEAAAIASSEYVLARDLAAAGIHAPIDFRASVTREDELLLSDVEARKVAELRATFATRSPLEVARTLADDLPAAR
jgi:transcription termination factor Rho